jgi:3-oxoacyl-[acyl-carrier-protein] synthase-3
VYINIIKSFFPEEVLDNKFFEERLDTSDEWITSRVGIKERRKCSQDDPTLFLGVNAVRQLPPEALQDLDCIIVGTSITQWHIPSTANLIAKELNIDWVPCFDIKAACSSFAYGAKVIQGLLATGYKKILFIVPEAYTSVVDYTDRSSAILWGDGAVACIFSNKPSGFEVIDMFIDSKSSGAHSVVIPVNGHFSQEGNKVQNFAVRYSIKASLEMLERNNLSGKVAENIDYLILHQANLKMMNAVAKHLGMKENQLLHNIEHYGNTAAVGAASVLAENWDKIKSGEKALITVVGSGLSWGSMLLKKV